MITRARPYALPPAPGLCRPLRAQIGRRWRPSPLLDERAQGIDALAVTDARLVVAVRQRLLEHPAFVHNLPLRILSKRSADDNPPPRERRNCAARRESLTGREAERRAP